MLGAIIHLKKASDSVWTDESCGNDQLGSQLDQGFDL